MEPVEQFTVVVNDEGQHSIWRCRQPLPAGWTAPGFVGSKEECLVEIEKRWTDIRPLSLQRALEGLLRKG